MKLGFVSSILDLNVSRSHAGLVQGRQREGMRGCAILIQRRLMIRRRSTS